jgi:hypothetical protein
MQIRCKASALHSPGLTKERKRKGRYVINKNENKNEKGLERKRRKIKGRNNKRG